MPEAVLTEAGQAAVESALVLPVTLFIILGLLQMGMIQQARLFADYAAFRGARAASMQMASCDAVLRAELAALTPTIGRSDSEATWAATFNRAKDQQGGELPLVLNFWDIDAPRQTIDTPVTKEADVSHVHLRMYYYYELRIPFVNWILSHLYFAQYGYAGSFGGDSTPYGNMDPLHPWSKSEDPQRLQASGELAKVISFWNGSYQQQRRYVVPLYASWSMRMFSRPSNKVLVVNAKNYCR